MESWQVGKVRTQSWKQSWKPSIWCSLLLNTWGRASTGRCHTFQNGEVYSQLDFLGTQRLTVDTEAKTAAPVSVCLVPWRSGPKHRPVFGSVKWVAGWACARHAKRKTPQQRFSLPDLKQHIQHNTALATLLKQEVETVIANHSGSVDLAALNSDVIRICQRLFRKVS